ncbi:MAG: YdcF family protein [Gammaproteobacteria bacterium]|nr:YdcF family protein [Gammaproteobacteria bacterium]
MYFTVSKILWPLLAPGNVLLMCLLAGTLAQLSSRRRVRALGRGGVTLALAALLTIAVFPVGQGLLAPLEARFAKPSPPLPRVDGIVVLGGALDLEVSLGRGGAELGVFADRLTTLISLARRHPDARLVFTGGSGSLRQAAHREADYAGSLVEALGLDPARLALERESRNTRENALFAKPLAKPRPGETWLLLTSAFHMPRAMGAFRRAGWQVTAYPVDYHTPGRGAWRPRLDLEGGLFRLTLALREWLGLAAYRVLGWTDEVLPGPAPG